MTAVPTDDAARTLAIAAPDSELRLMADALPVLVAYLEADEGEVRYRFANKIYEAWFPYRREEIIGRRVREVVGEKAYAGVADYIRRALQGERLNFEQFMHYKDAPARHIRVEYVPRWSDDKVIGVYTLVEDVTQAKQAEAALRESEEDYRYAAEFHPQVAWTARPDGQLDRVAPRWMEWTGQSGLGASYVEGLHPDDVSRTVETWVRSVETGEPYDVTHRVARLGGEVRWARSRAYARRDHQGAIVRWYGTTEDIHDTHVAQEHLKLMVLELNHRVKNNLAMVQSIAMQTLRGSDAPAAREAFLQRISALAVAHDILTRESWEGAAVAEVAESVLAPLTSLDHRLKASGPPLRLGTSAALALAMAFHELGTNATKYGALSTPGGTIDLTWSVDAGDRFTLTWREIGGPPVTRPTRRGFGTRLLERGVAGEMKGEATLSYEPTGVVYTLVGRVSAVAAEG